MRARVQGKRVLSYTYDKLLIQRGMGGRFTKSFASGNRAQTITHTLGK